jgi:hypothetical protein
MGEPKRFAGWINPLKFFALDEPSPSDSPVPSAEAFLDFLSTPGVPADAGSMAKRYREIAREPVALFITPAEPRILEKLVWPLRHAKAAYMVGSYLSTIALSGMVAEMVAMLLFDTAGASIGNRPLSPKDQEALFGREFEKLDQHRRVEVLRIYGIIDGAAKSAFDAIRTTRRKYLHLWSQEQSQIASDAVRVYHSALLLVVRAIGQDVKDGAFLLNPALVQYLERAGVCKAPTEPPEGSSP